MVRSKFPGKPSKIISRKIVDSAKFTLLEDNESAEAAENISYGLAMFNGSFGGDGQLEAVFHGFSPHDVEEAAVAAREQNAKVLAEYEDCGLSENSKDVVRVVLDPPLPQSFENDPSLLPWIEVARTRHAWPPIPSIETSSTSLNSATGNSRKFVLPSRSVHSARVIKPNKRFMDVEELSSVDQKESCLENKQLRTIELKKPRLILHDIKSVVTSSSVSNQSGNNLFHAFISSGSIAESLDKCHWKVCDKVQGGLSDLNVFGASVSQPCFHSIQSAKKRDSLGSLGENDYFTLSSATIGMFGKMGATVGQAQKLCVPKRNSIGIASTQEKSSEGSFASKSKKCKGFGRSKVLKASGTTVECGVCGAVHHYKFAKQARKFGIDSCVSCRKFIAKMVIRARSEKNFVKCISGEGNCFVSAGIRSTDSNNKDNRCWACWLEKCVRSYIQMPETTRRSLIAMLPPNMKSLKRRRRLRKATCNEPSSPAPKGRSKRKAEGPLSRRAERRSRLKEVKTNDTSPKRTESVKKRESDCARSAVARQQLVQKGPRVKHVCRSASIVLGQPLAVFESKPKANPATTTQTSAPVKEVAPSPAVPAKPTEPETCRQSSRLLESKLSKLTTQSTSKESACTSQQLSGRRVTRLPHNSSVPFKGHARSLQALSVYNTQPEIPPDLVALDFWESYDPDEVCNTGFGLIGCEPFQVRAVCFLCGSAGTSKLIHCASCCEPYHRFCVEMCVTSPQEEKWVVDWVCPRCTVCNGCGWSTGPQVNCQRCERSYHVNCLGATAIKAREKTPDRAWVCSSCLRCKSCNGPDVVKFVGNLPFCKPCFKLRRKGSFCPLCQCCYSDNDFHSKMMECAVCKAWVHAKCEELSDEKYQVLSYLPETVEYICRLCCTSPEAAWRLAVEAELKGGYLDVVKALTKNRKACTLLKWSPRKSCCSCQKSDTSVLQSASPSRRRLSFSSAPLKIQKRIPPPQTSPTEQAVKPEISLYDFDEEESEIGKYVNRSAKARKECLDTESVGSQDKGAQFSPLTGSQSDSGIGSTDDEFKAYSAAEDEETETEEQLDIKKKLSGCNICESASPIPSLFQIKKKVGSDQYSSILEFHQDMDSVMNEAESEELRDLYHYTLNEVFPWFDPEYPMSHNWRETSSPCKPLQGSVVQHQSTLSSFEKSSSIPKAVSKLIEEGIATMGNDYFYGSRDLVSDTRMCGLCKCRGDFSAYEQGRLLYCGYNEWVHVNCALWSGEVFEEIDGSLQNITSALSRSRLIRCPACGKKGASIGCCANNCQETFHFPCARSVGCSFKEDKTVYCPLHVRDAQSKTHASESDFHVARPVYVELDRRKKKRVESRQVRLMIGSLLVESLGTIVPEVSDEGSTLVPTQFRCSRLFWSVREPWRIVEYTVRTSIQMPKQEEVVNVHVTVDHSKESEASNLCAVTTENAPAEETPQKEEAIVDLDVVRNVVNSIVDGVCARETEEEVSDPQNSADLLPPELKDAIFEELPHDLLDGISMQDIFPKFLSLEDPSKEEGEDPCDPVMQVMKDVRPSNNRGLNDVPSKNNLVNVTKRLKRSKSDVLPDHVASTDNRLHQRSCSLAWSWKLDTTLTRCKRSLTMSDSDDRSRIIQQLHLSVTPATNMNAQFLIGGDKENHSIAWRHPQTHIMQVDGAVDSESSRAAGLRYRRFSDGFLAKPFKESVPLRKTNDVTFSTKRWCKSKPKMWRPRSRLTTDKWQRSRRPHDVIPQLDGAAEASSDSEADDVPKLTVNLQSSFALLEEQPVKCDRCYCTYRTEMSYTRHLPTCTGDLSSGSEEEHSDDEAPVATPTPPVAPVPVITPTSTVTPAAVTTPAPKPVPVATPAPVVAPPPKLVPIVAPVTVAEETPLVTSSLTMSAPTSVPQKSVKLTATQTQVPPSTNQLIHAPNTVAQPAPIKPATHISLTSAATTQARNTNAFAQSFAQVPQQSMVAMVDYQAQQQPNAPAVFVQCVPSPAMMPAYVDAFQQHTGHSLQHLATIDAHIPLDGAYITTVPNPAISRTFQLQATPDGQLRLEPTSTPQLGLSQLGLQLAQPQSQVVGAILPNGLTYTTTDGMYPAGSMLLTNQPMLTCMETVVSNTYMSMSPNQFVSGMLAGSSSFSSTTTQLYQGKPNPEVPTSFVLTSDSQLPNQLVVRSQPPSEPVFELTSTQERTPMSEQVKLPDLFTQPQVTQPQTFSLPLPALLTQIPVQSRPAVQRTYSKSAKNPKPDATPMGVAKTKPNRTLPPVQPSPIPVQPKTDNLAAPTECQTANLLVSPAPAQSITLPDPIAPSLSTDDILCSPKATLIPVTATTPVRNCLPRSIAVVHPIPVSTYAPQDRSKSSFLKKSTSPNAVPTPTITATSDKRQCTEPNSNQRSLTPVTMTKSALLSLEEFAELGVEKLSKFESPSVPFTSSAIFTPTKMSVPSTSETLSFACKPSLRSTWPASVTTQVTPSCTRPVITAAPSTKPVSTVLPTNCLSAMKTIAKENGSGLLPQLSVITPSPMEAADLLKAPTEAQESPKIAAIDLPPSSRDAPSAVTVAPPSITDPHVGKSVNCTSSPATKDSTSETQTTLKLLFQKQAHSGRYKVSSTSKFDPFSRPTEAVCLREKNSEKDQSVNNSGGIAEGSENVKPGDKTGKKSQPNNSTPKIVYEIHSQDGFTYSSTSISDAWQKVFGAVQEARANHNMAPLVHNPFSGIEPAHHVLGLGNNSLKYLLEQLPGVGQCTQYRPIYHKSRLPAGPTFHLHDDRPCPETTSGCARTDPYMCPKKFDMFSWLDSRHRCPPKLLENSEADGISGRRATNTNLPMAMKYRYLRETARTSVGVFRSDIHGRGLFCLRDIEAGEMVIEYAGEVIRNTLTDNRERYYQSKGIGCYMFKVDENFTVDATRRGNAARFINHSCEPNCYSRVVDILGKKHIIIFAFRRIPQGEELTYDYKFPIEDEKISCHCLSRRCRKYLN